MNVIVFVNRLTYVHYDLALYYNNYKPKKYAIFRDFPELIKMADKIPEIPLFDVYLALITIYYERALANDRSISADVTRTFERMRATEKVKLSFLLDDCSDDEEEEEFYLAKPVDIAFIKKNHPSIVKRLEEIARSQVRVTSYMSSIKFGGSVKKGRTTRRRRKN
jgi:hypothetical protein